jgi:signal transduction histidine kinase
LVETVNELIARIEQGVSHIEQFSQNVAHELRTPLTIVRGEMELALSGNAGAAELRRVIVSAMEEISRAAKIVESLLFLAHVDAGRMEAKKERVALDLLAAEVFEDAQALAEGRPLHLALQAPDRVVVAGDASRLRRLLLNLVENAIKYTPEGIVEIAVRQVEAQAIITVSDTGIGIGPEHLGHIFERFYRIDPDRSRETGGSGLGLSICAAIAHAHGGEIRVESTVGRGSTFEVKLPCKDST